MREKYYRKLPKSEYKNTEVAKLKMEIKKLKQENESLKKQLEKLKNGQKVKIKEEKEKITEVSKKNCCPSCGSSDIISIPRHDNKIVVVCKSCEYRGVL